jgi:hypothetical protein
LSGTIAIEVKPTQESFGGISQMSKVSLEKVEQMIKELSAEDRQKLIPFLAELPDSGLQSCDLTEEIEAIKNHGKKVKPTQELSSDGYLVDLIFVRNIVSVQIDDTEVLLAVFRPDNFIKAFPTSGGKLHLESESIKRSFFTQEKREQLRFARKEDGIQESDEEFEKVITETCNLIAQNLLTAKAENVAEQISFHLPGMVGDMIGAAIKGQTIADSNKLREELGRPDLKWTTEQIKKMVQDHYWRLYKPHLGITQGGNRRTDPTWQGDEVLIRYAKKVYERHLLAEGIKAMYEECLGDEGWIEDLRQDSTFQKLSQGVPDEIVAWAIRRVASDETMPKREREPLSIACEMARRELSLPPQDIETLRTYYTEGKKLIQQDRSKRSK